MLVHATVLWWLAPILVVGGWIALLSLRYRQLVRHCAHRTPIVWSLLAVGAILQLLGWTIWTFGA